MGETCVLANSNSSVKWADLADDFSDKVDCSVVLADPKTQPSQAPDATPLYMNGDAFSLADVKPHDQWNKNYIGYDWAMAFIEGYGIQDGKIVPQENGLLTLTVKVAAANNKYLSGLGVGYYTLRSSSGESITGEVKKKTRFDFFSDVSLYGGHEDSESTQNIFSSEGLTVSFMDTDGGRQLHINDTDNDVFVNLNLKKTPAQHSDAFVYENEITRARILRSMTVDPSSILKVGGSYVNFNKASSWVQTDQGAGSLSVNPLHSWNWLIIHGEASSASGETSPVHITVEGIQSHGVRNGRAQAGNVIVALGNGKSQRYNGEVTTNLIPEGEKIKVTVKFTGEDLEGNPLVLENVEFFQESTWRMDQKVRVLLDLLDLDFHAALSRNMKGSFSVGSETYTFGKTTTYFEDVEYKELTNEDVYVKKAKPGFFKTLFSKLKSFFP